MPFADYKNWEECISKNQDKDDPEAYCGKIKHETEDFDASKCVFKRMDCLEKKYPNMFDLRTKLTMSYDYCNSDLKERQDFGNGLFFTYVEDLVGRNTLKELLDYQKVKSIWNDIRIIQSPRLVDKENGIGRIGKLYLKKFQNDLITEDASNNDPNDPNKLLGQKEGNMPLEPVMSATVMARGVVDNKLYVRFHSSSSNTYKYEFDSNQEALQAAEEMVNESPGRWVWENLRGHQAGTPVTPNKLGQAWGSKNLTIGGIGSSGYIEHTYEKIGLVIQKIDEVPGMEETAERLRKFKTEVKAKGEGAESAEPIRIEELKQYQEEIYKEKEKRKVVNEEVKGMIEKLRKKALNKDMVIEDSSEYPKSKGKWVTIKGRRIFIPDGQELQFEKDGTFKISEAKIKELSGDFLVEDSMDANLFNNYKIIDFIEGDLSEEELKERFKKTQQKIQGRKEACKWVTIKGNHVCIAPKQEKIETPKGIPKGAINIMEVVKKEKEQAKEVKAELEELFESLSGSEGKIGAVQTFLKENKLPSSLQYALQEKLESKYRELQTERSSMPLKERIAQLEHELEANKKALEKEPESKLSQYQVSSIPKKLEYYNLALQLDFPSKLTFDLEDESNLISISKRSKNYESTLKFIQDIKNAYLKIPLNFRDKESPIVYLVNRVKQRGKKSGWNSGCYHEVDDYKTRKLKEKYIQIAGDPKIRNLIDPDWVVAHEIGHYHGKELERNDPNKYDEFRKCYFDNYHTIHTFRDLYLKNADECFAECFAEFILGKANSDRTLNALPNVKMGYLDTYPSIKDFFINHFGKENYKPIKSSKKDFVMDINNLEGFWIVIAYEENGSFYDGIARVPNMISEKEAEQLLKEDKAWIVSEVQEQKLESKYNSIEEDFLTEDSMDALVQWVLAKKLTTDPKEAEQIAFAIANSNKKSKQQSQIQAKKSTIQEVGESYSKSQEKEWSSTWSEIGEVFTKQRVARKISKVDLITEEALLEDISNILGELKKYDFDINDNLEQIKEYLTNDMKLNLNPAELRLILEMLKDVDIDDRYYATLATNIAHKINMKSTGKFKEIENEAIDVGIERELHNLKNTLYSFYDVYSDIANLNPSEQETFSQEIDESVKDIGFDNAIDAIHNWLEKNPYYETKFKTEKEAEEWHNKFNEFIEKGDLNDFIAFLMEQIIEIGKAKGENKDWENAVKEEFEVSKIPEIKKGKGWFGESERHSKAKLTGKADLIEKEVENLNG